MKLCAALNVIVWPKIIAFDFLAENHYCAGSIIHTIVVIMMVAVNFINSLAVFATSSSSLSVGFFLLFSGKGPKCMW